MEEELDIGICIVLYLYILMKEIFRVTFIKENSWKGGVVGSLQWFKENLWKGGVVGSLQWFKENLWKGVGVGSLQWFKENLWKGGVVGENTESDHRELVVFYYLPENDRREFVGKWEP